jgi:hypothetical protein
LGFATDSSSVSTTPLMTSASARHLGPRMVVDDDEDDDEVARVRSGPGVIVVDASKGLRLGDEEEELPSLEDAMGAEEHSPEEWLDWYQETFSTELSLFQSKQLQQQQQPHVPMPTLAASPSTLSMVRTEADRLRRRLRALDALEELGARVDATSQPLSARLWEADAPQCHGCREDLGLTRLKRRHHCRFCGLTFCHNCAPGEVRTCRSCRANRTRGDALRLVRAFERQALGKPEPSKEDVLCVARAYRSAMEAFAEYAESDLAKGLLLEGVHSFLDLDEIRICIGSRLNLSGLSLSPRT